jgi:hypothetical protein
MEGQSKAESTMTRGPRWIAVVGAGAAGVVAAVLIMVVGLAIAVTPWLFSHLLERIGLW